MNKKQVLVKGFEIGLQCKDVVSGQIKLAEEMMNIDEEIEKSCLNCAYASESICNYSNDNDGIDPLYNTKYIGLELKVVNCSGFKARK